MNGCFEPADDSATARDTWEELLSPASQLLEPVPTDLSRQVQRRIRRYVLRRRAVCAAVALAMLVTGVVLVNQQDHSQQQLVAQPGAANLPLSPPVPDRPIELVRTFQAEVADIRDAIAVPLPIASDQITVFQIFPTSKLSSADLPDSGPPPAQIDATTF
jgi:hypothetical protein